MGSGSNIKSRNHRLTISHFIKLENNIMGVSTVIAGNYCAVDIDRMLLTFHRNHYNKSTFLSASHKNVAAQQQHTFKVYLNDWVHGFADQENYYE